MKPNNPSRGNPPTANAKRQSPASAESPTSAAPGGNLKCAACNVAAATLHLTQLKNEKLLKLDLCDGCAEAFRLAPPDDAPTPPAGRASVSSTPSQAYLDCLDRRSALTGESLAIYSLTLPGLALNAAYSPSEVLYEVSMALFVNEELIKECVLARLPAWEAVEFGELVCISNGMHEGSKLKPDDREEWKGALPCGSFAMSVYTGDLLLHFCSVLYYHAELLCERLLPKLPFHCEAVRLSRALAISEQVLAAAGDKAVSPGTVAHPSRLLQRALDLHAEALLGANEGMIIGTFRSAATPASVDDKRIGNRAVMPGTDPKAAA